MDFSLLLTMVIALLRYEQRVSYRTLRQGLGLDDQTIEALRFELVDVKKVAVDVNGKVLVWVGGGVEPSPPMESSEIRADVLSLPTKPDQSLDRQSAVQFEYDNLGEHELKGIVQPVQAWRIIGEGDPESGHESKRGESSLPLVGRQEELGLLLRSWESSKQGYGQVMLIQGEGGIGKSRLIDALLERVSETEYVWVAVRCSPYHANSTLYPVIQHIKRAIGWTLEDSARSRFEKLEAALEEQSLPLEEAVPLYAELMSVPLG